MNITDYFYNTDQINQEEYILNLIKSNEIYFIRNRYNFQWIGVPKEKIIKDILEKYVNEDNFLNHIDKFIKPYGKLELFKFPPMTQYDWHVDTYNKCNFNLVFEHYNSLSLFKTKKEDSNNSDLHFSNFNIISLNYVPKTWYLFNTQLEHTVINLDEKVRYLLSYTVHKDCPLNYQQILEIVQDFKKF